MNSDIAVPLGAGQNSDLSRACRRGLPALAPHVAAVTQSAARSQLRLGPPAHGGAGGPTTGLVIACDDAE